jgi:hypothetical protein
VRSESGPKETWVALASAGIVAGCGGSPGATRPLEVATDSGSEGVVNVPVAVETSAAREPLRRAPPPGPAIAEDPGCGARSHECKGKNDCKGLGGCKNAGSNDCKGQNDCKGLGGCKTCE